MIVNRTTWAKMYGVSRAAVTQAIGRGVLVSLPDGSIDCADPVNVSWAKKKKGAVVDPPEPVKKQAAKETLPPVDDVLTDDAEDDLSGLELPELMVRKTRQEIRVKREQEKALRMRRFVEMGALVEREEVRQTLGKFNADLRVRLLELPQSIAPRLCAMARAGVTEHEIGALLETEIASAIDAAKGAVTRAGF